MEQEEDKKIGRPSLAVCMFCGLIFGLAVSAGWDNRGAGVGAGLLVYSYVRKTPAAIVRPSGHHGSGRASAKS